MEGLTSGAAALLRMTEEVGEITTIEVRTRLKQAAGPAALELERKLLVQSEQFHTERGLHAKRLRTWGRWSQMVRLPHDLRTLPRAKSAFQMKLHALNREYGGTGRLPWE